MMKNDEKCLKRFGLVLLVLLFFSFLGLGDTFAEAKQMEEKLQLNELTLDPNLTNQVDFSGRLTVVDEVYNKMQLPESNSRAKKELIAKRDKNSKTFLNIDNTVSVEYATYSLHYFDG